MRKDGEKICFSACFFAFWKKKTNKQSKMEEKGNRHLYKKFYLCSRFRQISC